MSDMPVSYRVGYEGPNVKFATVIPNAEVVGRLSPAQAREIAQSLLDTADLVERREGLSGDARQDIFVYPAVQHLIGSEPKRRRNGGS